MTIVDGPPKAFVLVVDSDCHRGRSLVSDLRSLGCYVAFAGSGAEALQYVAENEPDAVALDWDLRDMSGLELARRLTVRPRKPRIILLKKETDWRVLREALECGGDELLARPVSAGTLLPLFARKPGAGRRTESVSRASHIPVDGELIVAGGAQ